MPNRSPEIGFDDSHLFQAAHFVPELQPRDGEVVILKPSYGAFFDTPVVASDATATSLPEMHQAELCILSELAR